MLAVKEKISTRQAVILYMMIVYSYTIRLLPRIAAETAERAGWLTPVFAVLPFIGLVFIIQALFKKKDNANLAVKFFEVIGRIPGSILLCLYLIWIFIALGTVVKYFSERFLTTLFPTTSANFFIITILIIVMYAVRGGIVYIARTVEFIFYALTFLFIVIFLFTVFNIDIINIFPVTHYDFLPLVRSSFSPVGMWGAFTFIFFFGNDINDKEHIRRFGLQAAVYQTIMAVIILLQTIGVYGHSVISRTSLPYFFVVKGISVLDTIERIESIVIAFWVIVDFSAICVYVYILVSIIKSLFSISETKPLASPVIICAFIISQWIAKDKFELEGFSDNFSFPVNATFCFVIPFIIFIIGKIRKKI